METQTHRRKMAVHTEAERLEGAAARTNRAGEQHRKPGEAEGNSPLQVPKR